MTPQNADAPAGKTAFRQTLIKFIRFILSSCAATVLDLALFYALSEWIAPRIWPQPVNVKIWFVEFELGIELAAIAARLVSATVNFLLNRNFVFKLKGDKTTVWKYIFLCVVIMLIDGVAVSNLKNLLLRDASAFMTTVIKAGVDTVLFIINFFIQRAWVFKEKTPAA